MMGFGVTFAGYHFEDWQFTCKLAVGITQAHVGRALTQDVTAANQFKLAGDNDPVHGRLEVVEDRNQDGALLGTIAIKFSQRLPVKSGEVITVGQAVQGAGSGEVKALPVTGNAATGNIVNASHNQPNRVMEVGTGYVVVMKE